LAQPAAGAIDHSAGFGTQAPGRALAHYSRSRPAQPTGKTTNVDRIEEKQWRGRPLA
jgi:hypothetical protein